MTKAKKIIYWISTIWLALGMLSAGIVQILNLPSETEFILRLGYPAYILTLLGLGKILGVIAVLLPKFPIVKEWAYAGFFFTLSGAIYSHIAISNPFADIFPPLLLIVLVAISWYFRPPGRKVN